LLTRSTYNPRGQVTRVETELNPSTIYVTRTDYDDAGRAWRTWDASNRPTATEFDGAGRPRTVTYADTRFTQTAYDDFGRRAAQTDELGRTTNYEYDPFGRLSAVVQPAVADPEQGGTPVRPRTEYFYDRYGSLRVQRDAKGRDTTFRYDA